MSSSNFSRRSGSPFGASPERIRSPSRSLSQRSSLTFTYDISIEYGNKSFLTINIGSEDLQFCIYGKIFRSKSGNIYFESNEENESNVSEFKAVAQKLLSENSHDMHISGIDIEKTNGKIIFSTSEYARYGEYFYVSLKASDKNLRILSEGFMDVFDILQIYFDSEEYQKQINESTLRDEEFKNNMKLLSKAWDIMVLDYPDIIDDNMSKYTKNHRIRMFWKTLSKEEQQKYLDMV